MKSQPLLPLERWPLGHYVFFDFIQGINLALSNFHRRFEGHRFEKAAEELDRATSLMHGARAALRFAGAIDDEIYQNVVRVWMSPPHVPKEFSGEWQADHSHMRCLLKEIQMSCFGTALSPVVEKARQRFKSSIRDCYRAHIFVCRHQRGQELPSLQGKEHSEAKPATVALGERAGTILRSVKCPFRK